MNAQTNLSSLGPQVSLFYFLSSSGSYKITCTSNLAKTITAENDGLLQSLHYCNDPKFLNRLALANNVDPDQDQHFIMLAFLCNVDPLTPHFCIVKLGFTGVYIFSYFCSKTLIVSTR